MVPPAPPPPLSFSSEHPRWPSTLSLPLTVAVPPAINVQCQPHPLLSNYTVTPLHNWNDTNTHSLQLYFTKSNNCHFSSRTNSKRMEGQHSSIADIFPLLLPVDSSLQMYCGYLSVSGYEFPFSIALPAQENQGSLLDSIIHCSPELKNILQEHEAIIKQRLSQCSELVPFLIELKEILERILRAKRLTEMPPVNFYTKIIQEMDSLGWSHLVAIDDSLTSLELSLTYSPL